MKDLLNKVATDARFYRLTTVTESGVYKFLNKSIMLVYNICMENIHHKIIIDSDNTMGIEGRPMDDALAILYALGRSDLCEIVGITCNFGNGTIDEVYECTCKMLEEVGRTDIPVLRGSNKNAEEESSEASDFIVNVVNKFPGEITFLGIGSLGNLYQAYLSDNNIFDKIPQIVLMGGITEMLYIHNQPLDELNFSVNARASSCVLSRGNNVTVITGNNCLPVSALPKDEFLDNLCSSDNPSGMFIAQKCGYRFVDKKLIYGADSSYCWDGVASAFILEPELFENHLTPCLITEENIGSGGYLNPVSENLSNAVINIPTVISRDDLQQAFYKAWLKLNIKTKDAEYSCTGLYLDKLTQPCVLIELAKGSVHGFKLLQMLKEDNYVEPGLDPSGFYRNLKKMEKEGFIKSEAPIKAEKYKKIYFITDLGRRALQNWGTTLEHYEKHINHILDGISKL